MEAHMQEATKIFARIKGLKTSILKGNVKES
jgi:hypothetical protein